MELKVLVVDDNIKNVRLLTEILEDEGYIVFTCSNGLDVLKYAREIMPDIILLDIMMPGMDGFEVCKLLKIDFAIRDIPVIMVTAKTDGSDIKKAMELGAFDYIKKPVDEVEVTARVQSALRFKQHQDKLKEMAMKDGLTGVYNHSLLVDLLEKEFEKHDRSKGDITFVMIDVDYFKKINDTYGHMVGNIVLNELSQILLKSVRKSDIVGRYGGEEFGIILPDTSAEEAFCLCERIRSFIENYDFHVGDTVIRLTVSMGLSSKNNTAEVNYNNMVQKADSAMYKAKKLGRNRIEVYDDSENTEFICPN